MVADFCTALQFLTIIPVSWREGSDGERFSSAVSCFPLVGVIIGLAAMGVAYICSLVFPHSVVAFLSVVCLAFLTGALHLDGLADSSDGLLSFRPREQSLEIMKDSRIGAMGVVSLLLVILGKYSALVSLDIHSLLVALLFSPFAGRCAIVVTMAAVPYARKNGGLGSFFYTREMKTHSRIWLGAFSAAALLFFGLRAIAVLLVFLLSVYFFNLFCIRRIGGVTGDTLGAQSELAELVMMLTITALES